MAYMEVDYDVDSPSNMIIDEMSHAGWYSDKDGALIMDFKGVDHSFDPDKIFVSGFSGSGAGAWTGQVWEGRYVNPQGSSDQQVTIDFQGHYDGELICAGGSNGAKIVAKVENTTTGATNTEVIGHWWNDVVGSEFPKSDFYGQITTEFDPDHNYKLYVECLVWINCFGINSSAGADFGYQDGDGGDFVEIDQIVILPGDGNYVGTS